MIAPPESACGKCEWAHVTLQREFHGSDLPILALRCPAPSERPGRPSRLAAPVLTLTKPILVGETTMFPSLPSLAAAVLSQPFKRSQLGLFHGKTKQYGNNVPFSKKKTRRSWLPNIQSKRLYSDSLGETVRVKVSTRALKTIRKVRRLSLFITSHHDAYTLSSTAGSTSMCSTQSRTYSAGRACVYASQ